MTEPTEAEEIAAAKIIDPSAWDEFAADMWRPGHVEYRQREARKTARRALTAAAQVREGAPLVEIDSRQNVTHKYSNPPTEDHGPDILGMRKGEE